MKLVRRTFWNTTMPVIEIDGELFCSTEQLQQLLGIDNKEFTKIVEKNPDEFSPRLLSPEELLNTFCPMCKEVMTFFKDSRVLLWSEGDVVGFVMLSRSKSESIHKMRGQFIEYIKSRATKTYVE